MTTYDMAIVGNGILGCATALELKRANPDLTVAVVGPADRPGAASTAAGAMLGCFAEINHRSLSSAAGKEKLELSIRALDMWPTWLAELNSELPEGRRVSATSGTFVILNSRGGRLDSYNYQAILEALQAYHRSFEVVPFGEVPKLNASIDARPLAAVYLPDEGAIDARALLAAVVTSAENQGVTFIDDTVVGWKLTDSATVESLVTGSGETIHAARFLVAAGAASASILQQLQDDAAPLPPMVAGKGMAIMCRGSGTAIEHVVRTPNRAGGCGLHMVPGGDGTVYVGATNDLKLVPDAYPTVGMAHFLLGCAIEQLDRDLFNAEIASWHVGNRPGSLDGFPLIGKVWQDNVWVLSGTYRDGLHCSPALSRHMANVMLGGEGILARHGFGPLRRPLQSMNREQATDELVLHCVSQFYEFAARPPGYMKVAEGIENQVRSRTRQTYERLETDIGFAPEVLELLNWGADRQANIARVRTYLQSAQ